MLLLRHLTVAKFYVRDFLVLQGKTAGNTLCINEDFDTVVREKTRRKVLLFSAGVILGTDHGQTPVRQPQTPIALQLSIIASVAVPKEYIGDCQIGRFAALCLVKCINRTQDRRVWLCLGDFVIHSEIRFVVCQISV